ncbi:hypothetical protein VTI28DRAFT_1484 [Corynascus sepedonium]
MNSDQSSHDGAHDDSRLRESVSMVLRQLQQPQSSKVSYDEVPESDEAEVDNDGDDNEYDDEDDGVENGDSKGDSDHKYVSSSDEDAEIASQRQRRRSVSSAGSHYNPSIVSSETEPAIATSDRHSQKIKTEQLADTQPDFDFLPLKPNSRLPSSTPYSTVPPTPTQLSYWSSPRKRSLSPTSPSHRHQHVPDSAAVAGDSSPRPFKRHKSAPFNHAYLTLLNTDILDAAQRYAPHHYHVHATQGNDSSRGGGNSSTTALGPSQIGLIHWTEAEKLLFFEALARLGSDDVAGIAARVRTKGAIEVAAYLALLKEASDAATAPTTTRKEGKIANSAAVALEDMPAAVELSQACCAALEEAADAVAVRQEGYEEGVERRRWGDTAWLIGQWNYKAVEAAPPEDLREAVSLFRLGSWLRMSERVFMNSAVDEYNWIRVEGEKPDLRATAVKDFHALALEVTRRLVAATIFVGEARVKARKELYPHESNRVWKQDVEAAALSLGLPTNSRRFWARSARRLRLNVYDDEEDEEEGNWRSEDERESMPYDEVERALGLELQALGEDAVASEGTELSEEEVDEDVVSTAESDNGSVELGISGTPYASEYEEALPPEEDKTEKEAVTREMNEVLVHSALEYPKSEKPRAALRNRIRAERAHETYADRLDARASYYEEKKLWAMIERQPPVALVRPEEPEEPRKWTKKTVDELIRSFARTPGDWRSKLEVVPSKWEMDYALKEVEEKEKAQAVAGEDSSGEV